MTENDRVFDAFRNCITEPKCKDCPWTECDTLKNRVVEIPIDLALAVIRMLKAQESVKPKWEKEYAYCGQCGYKLHWIVERKNFCPNCGRAVKWDA